MEDQERDRTADRAPVRREMPNSIEAEKGVVGSMMMDRDAIVTAMGIIRSSDFYVQSLGMLFDVLVELFNAGQPTEDIVAIQEKLREAGALPEVSSAEYLTDIISAVPYSANIETYARIVKEKSILRSVIRLSRETENSCMTEGAKPKEILSGLEHDVFQLNENNGERETIPIREVVVETVERIHKASLAKGPVTGVPTGFIDLDYKLAGLQPADMVLLAARPSMGKTALELNIAEHVAIHEHLPVAIFSLEMPKEALVNRLLSLVTHIDAQKIRTGNLEDAEWGELVEGADMIGQTDLIIDDTPAITPADLESRCRKYKTKYPDLALVIVDYLQLMQASKRSDSRQQEISDISRSIKSIARELNVPILALSQLSRAPEQRPDHRPMLSDLRESGAIEQDADVVMFIYRDDYYNKDSDQKNVAEIIIAKQRNGPVGTVNLAWLPQYTKFANLDNSYKPRNQEEN